MTPPTREPSVIVYDVRGEGPMPEGSYVTEAAYLALMAERDAAVRDLARIEANTGDCKDCIGMKEHGCWCARSQDSLVEQNKVLRARLAACEKITDEMVTAASQFYSYGATRGNHSDNGHGPLPGPLTGHINAMGSLVRLLMALRAAVAAETQGEKDA